ncbi:DUF1772 domain-containing protein, partial [Tropicimonas sp. IMCC6043]|uniref:DUF1772 domain-containing protein n=1 Tax=Tropicimonas sp. IMCC6043 TaxID=2510645 RepID=UPI001A916859
GENAPAPLKSEQKGPILGDFCSARSEKHPRRYRGRLFHCRSQVSLAIAGYAAFAVEGPAGTMIALSGPTYLVGCFGVTVFRNVPMNEALARMDLGQDTTRAY